MELNWAGPFSSLGPILAIPPTSTRHGPPSLFSPLLGPQTFAPFLCSYCGFHSAGGSVVKILLPGQKAQGMWVPQEDPLKEETATHSSISFWEIP